MIYVGTTWLMPSPIADDVASQFDHCLEGSIGFGHTTVFTRIIHALF